MQARQFAELFLGNTGALPDFTEILSKPNQYVAQGSDLDFTVKVVNSG